MDRHEFVGLSAEEAALAHLKDLKVQGRYGVRFLTYWFDEERQTAFCLAEAPSADAVEEVHRASHGYMAYQIIEVDESMVSRFMGGIVEHPPGGGIRRSGIPRDTVHRHCGVDEPDTATRRCRRDGDGASS